MKFTKLEQRRYKSTRFEVENHAVMQRVTSRGSRVTRLKDKGRPKWT
jgi:hypothetical protein